MLVTPETLRLRHDNAERLLAHACGWQRSSPARVVWGFILACCAWIVWKVADHLEVLRTIPRRDRW